MFPVLKTISVYIHSCMSLYVLVQDLYNKFNSILQLTAQQEATLMATTAHYVLKDLTKTNHGKQIAPAVAPTGTLRKRVQQAAICACVSFGRLWRMNQTDHCVTVLSRYTLFLMTLKSRSLSQLLYVALLYSQCELNLLIYLFNTIKCLKRYTTIFLSTSTACHITHLYSMKVLSELFIVFRHFTCGILSSHNLFVCRLFTFMFVLLLFFNVKNKELLVNM